MSNRGRGGQPLPRKRTAPPPVLAPRVPTRTGSLGGVGPRGAPGASGRGTIRYDLGHLDARDDEFSPPGYTPGFGVDSSLTDLVTAPEHKIVEFLKINYPQIAAFMDIDPEVRRVLINGARQGFDAARLQGALSGTRWFQTTSAAARTWKSLVATDPAEAQRLAAQTAASIQNRAATLGLGMDPDAVANLALTATQNGWTDDQVIDSLVRAVNWGSIQGGELTAMRDDVLKIAGDYVVGVSASTAQTYAERIASGELTMAGVQSIMQRQARARFGWMGDQIDQGVAPADYFRPMQEIIAQELEVAPETINLMDPKWLRMVEVAGDDGQLRGATMEEARLSARRDPSSSNTKGGREFAASAAAMLGDVFGRRPI